SFRSTAGTIMKHVSFTYILLCAAFFTAGCASPTPVSLARSLGPSDGAAAGAPVLVPSAAQARRRGLKWKGNVEEKYRAYLGKRKGIKVEDGGGRIVMKLI
ncbi:unnamed protein product, partial [Closterium sp. Naga37s-1]